MQAAERMPAGSAKGRFLPLRLWSRRSDFRWCVELLEILGEAVAQVFGGFIVGGFVAPGVARIQDLWRNARTGLWNGEAKGGLDFEFFADQLALDRRVDHGAGVGDFHALAYAVRSALPARVDQPALRVVLAQAAAEHFCISFWRQRHERRSETCGECGRRLFDAGFGARYFRGVTR